MKKILATLFALALSCTAAQAATFDFTGSGGLATSYTFMDSGISVTATATSFSNAGILIDDPRDRIGQYSQGLGATTHIGDSHQTDGANRNDLIVFDFDQEIILESVTFTHVDSNDDFRFFFESGSTLTDWGSNIDIPGSGPSGTYIFNAIWAGDLFGIGARDTFDNFKISGMTVSAVPLPAALPLYGAGMAIIGFIGWRRKKRLSA